MAPYGASKQRMTVLARISSNLLVCYVMLPVVELSVQTGFGVNPASYPGSVFRVKGPKVKLATLLYLVSILRMCGAVPPLQLTQGRICMWN
jgi:hypothetical protein